MSKNKKKWRWSSSDSASLPNNKNVNKPSVSALNRHEPTEQGSSKLERISRHADNVISVTVTLSVEKLNNKAEADVHLAGKDLHVETVESDMYAAVDVLMDKLDRAVLKHKEKRNDVRATAAPAPVEEA